MHTLLALAAIHALAGASVDATSMYLTGLAAQGAGTDARADVVTQVDIQTALALEGDKQLVCNQASSSCIAEIAAALDAAYVVSGALFALDETQGLSLQVSVYDVKRATSLGRRTLVAKTIVGFAGPLEEAVAELMRSIPSDSGARFRVIVFDFDASAATLAPSPSEKPAPDDTNLLLGGTLGAAAGATVIAGGILLVIADDANRKIDGSSPADQLKHVETRDTVLLPGVLLVAAGTLGAGIIAAVFLLGGAEQ